MKKEQFLEIMDEISDDIVEDFLDIPSKVHAPSKKTPILKVILLAAAISLIISGTAYAGMTVAGKLFVRNNYGSVRVFIEQHPTDKTFLEKYYFLPEDCGWEFVDIAADHDNFRYTRYERDGYRVAFQQTAIFDDGIIDLDWRTQNADIETLSLWEENDAIVFELYGDDFKYGRKRYLYWVRDGYLFSLQGTINREDAIRLAYSATTELP